MTLILLVSLKTEVTIVTVKQPTFAIYKRLEAENLTALQCPCQIINIPYNSFISINPVMHQVCSSDITKEYYYSLLQQATKYQLLKTDWRTQASQQLQLLSKLCEQANNTIDDSVNRFKSRSLVTSNLLLETDFINQLNSTLRQFMESQNLSYSRLIDIVHLFSQVDQYYAATRRASGAFNAHIGQTPELIKNGNLNQWKVCQHSRIISY